ncbi:AAA domain-containing protein, partial [Haematococcus lacustris]
LRQKVLVLVGVPGSGKSTIAQQLREAGWVVVNQDVLGSRRSCEAAFDEALQAGRNVVVDRCNFDAAQRSTWVRLSLQYSSPFNSQAVPGVLLIALELDLPLALCIQRVEQRRGHPTLSPSRARGVVGSMASQWQVGGGKSWVAAE